MDWLVTIDPDISWRHRRWAYRDEFREVTSTRPIQKGSADEVEALATALAAVHITFGDSPTMDIDPRIHRFDLRHMGAVATILAPGDPSPSVLPHWWGPEQQQFFDMEAANALPAFGKRDHAINLIGDPPRYSPIYPLHQRELEVLKEYIEKALVRGWIRRSTSPIGAPVVFVPKKGGELRLCQDYRALNTVTEKDRTPIPLIDNMMDRLTGATVFTKLDLKHAYHRVRIKEGDEWKTAWRCRYGHFEYCVMPFGLTNAPATFQRHIEEVLAEFTDDFCTVYLDDVLIYSTSDEEHEDHVKRVIRKLVGAGLYGNPDKCEFVKREVSFLGFVITQEAVQMEPERVRAVVDWPEPSSVTDILSFLGFCGFYRRFIKNYSKIVTPLTDLTATTPSDPVEKDRVRAEMKAMSGKDRKRLGKQQRSRQLNIGPRGRAAVAALKAAFVTGSVTRHYHPELPLRLETDASDFAIGAVLSQQFEEGWHPIAFMSRKLSGPELSYSTPDQELLAIGESFSHWRRFLAYPIQPIDVRTDHLNHVTLMEKKLSLKQANTLRHLSSFDFTITHIAGSKNPADPLSRRADHDDPREREEARQEGLPEFLSRFQLPGGTEPVPSPRDLEERGFGPVLAVAAYRVGTKTLEEVMLEGQRKDQFVAKGKWEKQNRQGVEPNTHNFWSLNPDTGLLYRGTRVYVPADLREEVIRDCHDAETAGHPGVERTLSKVQSTYFWPRLIEQVQEWVRTCVVCQRSKPLLRTNRGPLQPLPVPHTPFTDITMDMITDLPVVKREEVATVTPSSSSWTASPNGVSISLVERASPAKACHGCSWRGYTGNMVCQPPS
jgi:hypothetical protein